MAKGKGNRRRDAHSFNPQSSSRGVGKRVAEEHWQQSPGIHLDLHSVPTIAPSYASATTYSNFPRFQSALASTASYSQAAVQGEKTICKDQLSGYIFMCNRSTKADCYKYRVFGLPAARMEVVEKIKPQMKLFLFDFDLKLLYGIYVAVSNGESAIEPTAFGGKFSAQVRFEIFKDCLPLPESVFKRAIKDNYQGGFKFKQELNDNQVMDLMSLFRPTAIPPPSAASAFELTAVPPAKTESLGIDVWSRGSNKLSASYDRYLAGLHSVQAGSEHRSQHAQKMAVPISHVPHASAAKVQPMHLQPVGTQPQSELYYPAETRQVYSPEKAALLPQDSYGRYAAAPRAREVHATANVLEQPYATGPSKYSAPINGHDYSPSSSGTAAYWITVAAEGLKQVYPTGDQSMPSGSNGIGVPVTYAGSASTQSPVPECGGYTHNPEAAAANALVQAQATEPLQFQAPLQGLASSSLRAGCWAVVASHDPNQVYYQWQTSTSTNPSVQYVPLSLPGAESAPYYSLPGDSAMQQFAPHAGTTNAYHGHNMATTNGPEQAHDQVAYNQWSQEASYWTAVASQDPNLVTSNPR